jgi:hypothetical protein
MMGSLGAQLSRGASNNSVAKWQSNGRFPTASTSIAEQQPQGKQQHGFPNKDFPQSDNRNKSWNPNETILTVPNRNECFSELLNVNTRAATGFPFKCVRSVAVFRKLIFVAIPSECAGDDPINANSYPGSKPECSLAKPNTTSLIWPPVAQSHFVKHPQHLQ